MSMLASDTSTVLLSRHMNVHGGCLLQVGTVSNLNLIIAD